MSKGLRLFRAVLTILLLASGILVGNRYYFGTWLPTSQPNRIDYAGHRYYPQVARRFAVGELQRISPWFYWGRGLFVDKRAYEEVAVEHRYSTYMVLYLAAENGLYQAYVLSGGP